MSLSFCLMMIFLDVSFSRFLLFSANKILTYDLRVSGSSVFLVDAYRMVLDIVDIYLRMIKENKGEIL